MHAFSTLSPPPPSPSPVYVTMRSLEIAIYYCREHSECSGWDVSAITDMSFLCAANKCRYVDVAGWDTSRVTTMHGMFKGASDFNQDISGWNVGSVTSLDEALLQYKGPHDDVGHGRGSDRRHGAGLRGEWPVRHALRVLPLLQDKVRAAFFENAPHLPQGQVKRDGFCRCCLLRAGCLGGRKVLGKSHLVDIRFCPKIKIFLRNFFASHPLTDNLATSVW